LAIKLSNPLKALVKLNSLYSVFKEQVAFSRLS
jgi:hypothetical protein